MILFLINAVAFAAQPSFAATSTIGDLVAEGLCPEARTRLQQNALLNTALTLAANTQIELPDSGTPILFAPSDAALLAALPKLGVSVAQLASKPELIKSILDLHLASAAGPDSTTATTLADTQAAFMTSTNQALPLSQFIVGNAAELAVRESATMAGVEDIVACPGGPVAVFTNAVFLPAAAAPSPASAPAPAPSAPTPTIGGLVGAICPAISDVISGPNFSTLLGLLTDPQIAATEINLPKGLIVVAAPTNAAFASYLASVSPSVASNKTALATILANHIATATAASDSTAKALSGETMGFFTKMDATVPSTPTSIASVAATKTGMLTSEPAGSMTNVVGAVSSCSADGQIAFGVDQVLPPAGFLPTPAPAPGPAPAPKPAPVPAPPAPSAGFKASAAFAVVATIALFA